MRGSDAPPSTNPVEVQEDWLDLYGHMNMAKYVVVFDAYGYELQGRIGVGSEYTKASRCGLFVVDARITYRQELVKGQRFIISLRILESDHIRLLTLLVMRLASDGAVVATMEQLAVNVSLDTRRACPFNPGVAESLRLQAEQHRMHKVPAGFSPLLTCSAGIR